MKLRLLSARDVQRALPVNAAIESAREAFTKLSLGEAVLPMRTALPTENGMMLFMPGFIASTQTLAQKMVGIFPRNAERNLPTVNGFVVVFDSETGIPRALLDAQRLTAIRTGAASALATDLLARTEARVLAVFGAGDQAREQIRAIVAVREIEEVRIKSANGMRCVELSEQLGTEGINAQSVRTSAEALQGADIVCCATTSREPVFRDDELEPGTHINAVGAYIAEMQEVPAETVARAYVVVDHREAAMEEAGDLIKPFRAGLIGQSCFNRSLGDLLLGIVRGRESEDEITLFKSVGLAVQDLTAAARAIEFAEANEIGTVVEF